MTTKDERDLSEGHQRYEFDVIHLWTDLIRDDHLGEVYI